jgi:hypothetical protein
MANRKRNLSPGVLIALIGALATVVVAALNVIGNRADEEASAMKKLQPTITTLEKRLTEALTQSVPAKIIITKIVTPTLVPAPTKPPTLFDLRNWQTDFCDEKCGKDFGVGASSIIHTVVAGRTYEALEVVYTVNNSGWVLVKKNITPDDLAGTKGISFFYKGTGKPNSIELKLLLRYPGDIVDTTFGVLWTSATDTGDQWKSHQALYEVDFSCWGPPDLCQEHDNVFDMESVHRLEFGISNKGGDAPGLGKITFDDVMGIPE